VPIILFFAFMIFLVVIDKPILNKLNVERKRRYGHVNKFHLWSEERKRRYVHVNKFHLWSEVLLFVLLTTIVYFSGLRQYFLHILLSVLFSYRAFMEWKFAKESKAYIISILDGSRILLFVIVLTLLLKSN